MRRILSIWIALVLGLGPAMAAVPANALTVGWGATQNESRLPACCRKNGVHHCAQSAHMQTNSGETTISATGCCPCWPGTLASTTASIAAVVQSTHSGLSTGVERYQQQSFEDTLDRSTPRAWPKRGPPTPERI